MGKIYSQANQTTSDWSGGRTTQLYIYPEDAVFGHDRFDLRVSIASVDKEQTVYTPFPTYMRSLHVISGSIILSSANWEKALPSGENLLFSGDEKVNCLGTSQNLNVIFDPLRYKTEIELSDDCELLIDKRVDLALIIPLENNMGLSTETGQYHLSAGDYWIGRNEPARGTLANGEKAVVIRIKKL
jgi:environmental stress-induced protein Ves